MTLLPPNANPKEIALSEATNYRCEPDGLLGFKFNPTNEILPWLIWEYGLGEIAQWVDKDKLLAEGVAFQRLRGTPAALKLALSWLNLKCDIEEEPPGAHFAEFQLNIDDIPKSTGHLYDLITLAIPARSRLSRIYNKHYDIRRFMLSESDWGNMLSDYSGIRTKPDAPVLSLGRKKEFAFTADTTTLAYTNQRSSTFRAMSEDVYRLDFAVLGDTNPHVFNQPNMCARYHVVKGLGDISFLDLNVGLVFQFTKAQIILSDSEALGSLNACFPSTGMTEVGTLFEMDSQQLSEQTWSFKHSEVLERADHIHPLTTIIIPDCEISESSADREYLVCQAESDSSQTATHDSCHCISLNYAEPNTWHQHKHFNQTWHDQQTTMGASH